jgi:hypothetical protein
MTQWADKSILGNTMTAFSNFSNVTVSSNYQNGLNVLNFSGAGVYQAPVSSGVYPVDVYLILALKDTTTHVDVFSVESSNAGAEFNSLSFGEYTASRWHNGSDGFARTPNTVSTSNETSTSFLLMNWSISNSNYIIRRLGTELKQTTSYTFTFPSDSRFQLGFRVNPNVFSPSNTAGPFRGYIGEIIAFNSQLETTKRQQIEGYLSWKWGLVPPSTAGFVPTSISSCELWFDGGDYTTMFQNTAGTSNVTTSNQSVACWKDKIRNLSVTDTGISGRASVPPTSVSGGGLFFSNVSAAPTSNTQSLGAFSSGTTNQDSYLFRMPTKSMTMFIASYPSSNNGYRRISLMGSYPLSGGPPNFLLGPQMGASEGGTIVVDLNSGMSAWAQEYNSTSGYNSNTVLRVDTLTIDTTGSWFTNGSSNTFTTNTSYTSSNTNYPVNFLYFAGYSGTIDGGRSFHGNIYEFLLYSKVLSTSERKRVESYLSKKWLISLSNVISYSHPFYTIKPYLRIFQPTDISNCVVWLDALDRTSLTLSGSNVTQWMDKSGFSNNVTEISTTPPTYNSTDSSINFTATSPNFVRGTLSSNYSNASVFVVASISANPSPAFPRLSMLSDCNVANSTIIGQLLLVNSSNTSVATYLSTGTDPTGQGTNFQTFLSNVTYNTKQLITNSTTYSGSTFTISTLLNGNTQANSSRTGTFAASGGNVGIYNKYSIGSYPDAAAGTGDAYQGKIFEYLVFNTALTTSERQQVEGYLANKWKITLGTSTHPFYKFAPSTALPFFPKNITGLSLWLDGNDPAGTGIQPSAGALATWADKSGSNNHMTAVGTTPTFSNHPPGAVYFGGSGYFSNSNAVLSNVYTIFFIFKNFIDSNIGFPVGPLYTTGIESSGAFFLPNFSNDPDLTVLSLDNTSTNVYAAPTSFPLNQMNLAVLSFSGNEAGCNISLYYNGSNVVSTTQDEPLTYSNLRLGYYDGAAFYYTGYMYEVIAYSGTLTTRQRQSVEGYLAQKWKL